MKYLVATGLAFLAFMFILAEANPFVWTHAQRFSLLVCAAGANVMTWFCNAKCSL
jgi:hypothetical protein